MKTHAQKKKTSIIFDLFRGLCDFFQKNFSSSMGQFSGSTVKHTLQKSEELPLACLFEVFTGLWLSTPTFCIRSYDYVEHFVRVLVVY